MAKGLFAARVVLALAIARPQALFAMHLGFLPMAAALRRFFRFRLVLWLHGVEAWNAAPKNPGSVDQFVTVSQTTLGRTAHWRPTATPCRIIYPTTDFTRFSPGPRNPALQARYGLKTDTPVILTVSRLSADEAYKGHDAVIASLPKVAVTFPEVRYLIVGEGDDRARLERLATLQRVRERVIFAGRIAADELADHYRLASVFAMPSRGEGFGISYLEAVGCGCAVIAGNEDAGREALLDGKLGCLVDPEDRDQLADALCQSISHRPAPEIRELAIQTFGWDRFCREVREVCAG